MVWQAEPVCFGGSTPASCIEYSMRSPAEEMLGTTMASYWTNFVRGALDRQRLSRKHDWLWFTAPSIEVPLPREQARPSFSTSDAFGCTSRCAKNGRYCGRLEHKSQICVNNWDIAIIQARSSDPNKGKQTSLSISWKPFTADDQFSLTFDVGALSSEVGRNNVQCDLIDRIGVSTPPTKAAMTVA
jgi:hypothetical protein